MSRPTRRAPGSVGDAPGAGTSSPAAGDYTLADNAELRAGLSRLLEERSLCDVELVSQGKNFPAHKVVLAAICSYFEAMFTGGFRESQGNTIEFQEMSSQGLEILLDAIYKGRVHLEESIIVDTVSAAHHVQYTPLLSVCEAYLTETLTPENCIARRRLASTYDMRDVIRDIDLYVLREFKHFRHSQSFVEMPVEDLCRYLQSDDLLAEETEVFEAMKRWIEHEATEAPSENTPKEEDFDWLARIAPLLRWGLIDPDVLHEVAEFFPSLEPAIREALTSEDSQSSEETTDTSTPISKFVRGGRAEYRPRGCNIYAMLIRSKPNAFSYFHDGNGDKTTFLREVENAQSRKDLVGWHEIPRVPYLDRSVHSFAYNGYWLVFGCDSDSYSPVFHCFDSRSREWTELANPGDLCECVVGSYAFKIGTQIMIGGGNIINSALPDSKDDEPLIIKKVCVFDLVTAKWRRSRARHRVWNAASCVFLNHGYVIGGHVHMEPPDENDFLHLQLPDSMMEDYAYIRRVVAFDPEKDAFVEKAPLNVARCGAAAGVLNADDPNAAILVVVGGLVSDSRAANPGHNKQCEVYSPRTNQWTCVLDDRSLREGHVIPTPGGGFGILQGDEYPMQYYETDNEGKLRTYKKVVEPAVRWYPGKDHWSYLEGSIMTVAVLTMLPVEAPSWPYKPKETSLVMTRRL